MVIECSVDDCRSGKVALGMCDKHYRRFRKYGDPNKTLSKSELSVISSAAARKRIERMGKDDFLRRSEKYRKSITSKRLDVKCVCCGSVVVEADSKLYEKKRRNKTCSKKCHGEMVAKRNNTRRRKNMAEVGAICRPDGLYVSPNRCALCSGQILVEKAREVEKKKFCSVKCKARWQAKLPYEEWRGKIGGKNKGRLRGDKNPMWGLTPAHGKRTKYTGADGKTYVFRSTWEATVACYFDKICEPWEYEPKKFVFSNCTYTPDFYLPLRSQYVEVKGWMSGRSKKQIEAFRRESGQTLVVYGKEMYSCIQRQLDTAS